MKYGVLLLLAVGLPAMADIQTTGLYGTGLKDDRTLLNPGASDPHYSFIFGGWPSGTWFTTISPTGPEPVVVAPGVWPLPGAWVPNTNHSQWIGPRTDAAEGEPPQPGQEGCGAYCDYLYATKFDVTNPGLLTGMWTSDNGSQVFLVDPNGHQISGPDNGLGIDNHSYSGWNSFSFNTTEKGTYELLFLVQNYGTGDGYPSKNPTGLQVAFVPEPGVLTLGAVMGGALFLASALRRKRG
jgi:hypothetical protein